MGGLTINAGWVNQMEGSMSRRVNENENQGEKKSQFAGDLNLANDPIARKRKEAQELAWNIVKNAWDSDKSVDEMIESRKKHAVEMEKRIEESTQALAGMEDDKDALRQLYDVSVDSQEQKDLELLEKRQDIKNGVTREPLTGEEEERLAEIDKRPLTEYQERALELNKRAGIYKRDIEDAERQMRDDTADIRSIEKERLKSNPMLDAKKQAEEIFKSANEQIVGMLVQEATDHIDEVMEEGEEKAEEAAEKKEEKEEKLEEIKEQRAIQKAIIEGTREAAEEAKAAEQRNDAPEIQIEDVLSITKGNSKTEDVESSLNEIKNSMKLLEADLKGIKVDEEV